MTREEKEFWERFKNVSKWLRYMIELFQEIEDTNYLLSYPEQTELETERLKRINEVNKQTFKKYISTLNKGFKMQLPVLKDKETEYNLSNEPDEDIQ